MGRFFFILLLGLAVFAGVAWWFEPFAPEHNPHAAKGDRKAPTELGPQLFENIKQVQVKIILDDDPKRRRPRKQIVLHDCNLTVIDQVDIAAPKDGVLLFIGEAVTKENPDEKEPLPTAEIIIGDRTYEMAYRRLKEGDIVKKGQMLAVVDPTRAMNELLFKKAKIVAARAEHASAVFTHKEAQARLDRLDALKSRGGNIVAAEDYSAAVLTRDRHREDAVTKEQQIKIAEIDADQAAAERRLHDIRNVIPGRSIIKQIYKKMGEGVKNLEPVMRLDNLSRLRVEGLLDSQHFEAVRKEFDRADPEQRRQKLRVILEPTQEMGHEPLIKSHTAEVNAVAVCRALNATDHHPRFVSASEDRTAHVWGWDNVQGKYAPGLILNHSSPVRSVACDVHGGKAWCATGCADGTVYLWDLDDAKDPDEPRKPAHVLKGQHQDAITALAFSPDGNFLASGGQDNNIVLWRAATGERAYPFDFEHGVDNPHQGTVTALHFTPDCKLVSASRDNTLRVWSLFEKGARLDGEPVAGRGGAVTQPGVSADGKLMVFDKGRTLQMIETGKQRRPRDVLENPPTATAFETFALFSPDGSLMLTTGGAEGRMQLWRAPGGGSRAYELRQLVSRDRSPTTCAAFAPSGGFLVSGTKEGYVHLWQLPTADELKSHRIHADSQGRTLTLDNLDRSLESGRVRVTAAVQNPESQDYPLGRLAPGRRVTLVIELD